MASTLKLSLIVSAVDEATAPVRRINQAINNLTAGPRAVGAALGRLATEAGLATVTRRAGTLGGALRGAWQEAGALGFKLAALAGLGGGGMVGLLNTTAAFGENIVLAAERLGMTTRAFQELRFAAEQSGVTGDQFAESMRFLAAKATEAAAGSQEAAQWFRAAGVSVQDASGRIKGTDVLFGELADAFNRSSRDAEKVKVAMALLGDSGVRMVPFMNQGAREIARLRAEAERLGLVITDDLLNQAKDFGDRLGALGAVVRTVGFSIGSVLIPVVEPLVVRMTEWAAANRELIATRVQEFVGRVVEAIPDLVEGAQNIAAGFQGVINVVRWVGDTFGYTESAAVAIGLYLGGPLIGALANVALAATLFGTSLGGVALRLGALAFAPVVAAIGNFVTAIRAGYSVMAAFNLVLAANPIGLVVAGATALAGIGYVLYQRWTPFRELLDWIGNKIASVTDLLPEWITRPFGGGATQASTLGVAPPVAATTPALAAPPAGSPGAARAVGPGGQPFAGELVVRFDNAPPGTRIDRLASNGAGPDIGVDLGPTMVMP